MGPIGGGCETITSESPSNTVATTGAPTRRYATAAANTATTNGERTDASQDAGVSHDHVVRQALDRVLNGPIPSRLILAALPGRSRTSN